MCISSHIYCTFTHNYTLLQTIKAYFLPQSQETIVVIVMVKIHKINITYIHKIINVYFELYY